VLLYEHLGKLQRSQQRPVSHERTIKSPSAGRYDACTKTNTCPLAMEIYSENEYWVKGASLFHTDPMGKLDLPGHPMARLYLISSHQHGVGNGNAKGSCQQFGKPTTMSSA
jgi:hypothetical protein